MDGQHLRPFQVLCTRNHVPKLIGHPRKHALSFSPADYQGLRQKKMLKENGSCFLLRSRWAKTEIPKPTTIYKRRAQCRQVTVIGLMHVNVIVRAFETFLFDCLSRVLPFNVCSFQLFLTFFFCSLREPLSGCSKGFGYCGVGVTGRHLDIVTKPRLQHARCCQPFVSLDRYGLLN